MSHIAPFRAIRPTQDKAHLVASRSYVSYRPADLRRKLHENPYTFIHIINPEFDKPYKSPKNSDALFTKVKEKFGEFMKDGIFVQDPKPALYIYQQITPEATFTGLVCGIAVKDYLDGHVKIHEHTITAREEVFCKYLDICDFNAEPVLLTYRDNIADLRITMAAKMTENPVFDFTTTDRNRHKLWMIDSDELINEITSSMDHLDTLYIADGHHRMASSARLGKTRAERNAESLNNTDLPHNFALALIIPSEDLRILPFHRLLKMDESFTAKSILKLLDDDFLIQPRTEPVIPQQKRVWGLRLSDGWYELRLKHPYVAQREVDHLDAVIITKKALEPIFGILDQKTDKRISFIPGNEPLAPFEKAIQAKQSTALITLHGVSQEELFAVADAGEIMPPKSTWIAPKLRSGLTIMPLS